MLKISGTQPAAEKADTPLLAALKKKSKVKKKKPAAKKTAKKTPAKAPTARKAKSAPGKKAKVAKAAVKTAPKPAPALRDVEVVPAQPVAKPTPAYRLPVNKYAPVYAQYIEDGHYQAIEPVLRARLMEEPQDAKALTLLGRCRLRQSDYAAAVRYLTEAELISDYDKQARRDLAEALDGMGRADEARALLMRTIRFKPTTWEFYWDYARLVEKPEDYAPFRDHCMDLRAEKPVSAAIDRAFARAATFADDFETAFAIYRNLVAKGTNTLTAQAKAAGADTLLEPADKTKKNDLAGGKGEVCLKAFKAAMASVDVPFFLMAGTVLGYIRDGKLLTGDKDVDVGVFEKDYDKPKIEAALRESGEFQIRRVDNHADRIRAIHSNGVWIDVFPYFTEGHRTWHAGTVARWWHEPFDLAPYMVEDTEFMIPADTDAYLAENYGPDWRIPNALFDVYNDAPNAEIMRPDFLRYQIWRKIHEGMTSRNWQKVQKYLGADPELLQENPWLIRLGALADHQISLMAAQTPESPAASAAAPVGQGGGQA
ncbi:MAG: LicD family protein [Natronohydrobacter sp.]|nr:LicD family protein [Natronohydrobacter sp.]